MIFVSVNGKWFFTYTEENDVYIEPGRNHANRSKITVRRRLDKKNFEKVLDMYIRNEPRIKIRDVTQNSSYWIGIFAELLEKSQVDMEEHV